MKSEKDHLQLSSKATRMRNKLLDPQHFSQLISYIGELRTQILRGYKTDWGEAWHWRNWERVTWTQTINKHWKSQNRKGNLVACQVFFFCFFFPEMPKTCFPLFPPRFHPKEKEKKSSPLTGLMHDEFGIS